jgi:hypothetical protein
MATADPTNTRQRIDYIDLPGGGVKAVLTISLPGGIVKRFEAVTDPSEMKEVSGALLRSVGCCMGDEVGKSIFKKIGKGIGKIAKGVASSKVFQLAAKGLALASPLLGPIAPFALGAAAAAGVASKLAKAGVAAAHGAHDVAKALTLSAHGDAVKLTSTPAGAARLLATANAKRLGAEKVAAGKSTPAPKSKPNTSALPSSSTADIRCAQLRGTTEADLLAAAKSGRVRSNQAGTATPSQLLAAHKAGRIYWVS